MKRQQMFIRMITASLLRRRSRMLVALLAIAIGGTILSGLVTIYYDVPRQMGAQFRSYGANMIFTAAEGSDGLTREQVSRAAEQIDAADLVGLAPYRYESVRINERPVIVAGTDMTGAQSTSPYWFVTGAWPEAPGQVLIGKAVAATYRLSPGDTLTAQYTPDMAEGEEDPDSVDMEFTVTGILDTGGSEEEYIFISLDDMAALTGEEAALDLAEFSVSGGQAKLEAYTGTI